MNKIKKAMTYALVLALLSAFLPMISLPVYAQETGPATDKIIFKRVPVDLAAEYLRTGQIDYYIFGLRPAQAEALAGVEDIKLYYAPAGLVDIGLNPAPAEDGLNPLAIREIRFALNYLMDRDYVVNQIYKGFASPMVTFLSSYDPDYVTIYDIVAKYDFKYDPVTAASIIDAAMTQAGATKQEGKWYYGGKPVTLKFIIRTEDERREIGDAFASALEAMGFTVNRLYMPFGSAIAVVYGTDPKDLEWHLYTEGWGKSVVEKYDYATINQFGCPWAGWMPGYQEPGYWQYENSTLDDLGQRIYKGNFSDKNERDSLYRQATEMIIQESVRIWAATRLEIHPARKEVMGLTNDLGTGLRSPLNPREVYVSGRDNVTVGHLWVYTETSVWNPIGGHDDVYSVDMWRAVHDPFIWRHPFSGKPMPFRWDYTVTTAGPDGTLSVPADAFLWDNNTDSWVTVGSGVKAKSKVVFDLSKYIGTKWHHLQNITWADILYSIYQHWEIAFDTEKSALEGSTAAALKEILSVYKGFRIDGTNLEVYLDYWHFDPAYIADYADVIGGDPPMGHYPWEVLAAMDRVVFENKTAAYSQSAAKARGVPWLSVNLPDHAEMVKDAIEEFKTENFLPINVFNVSGTIYATADEANARFNAAIQWFTEKGNMVISDGPFYLNVFDSAAQYAELVAFRDATYPFRKGDWYYGLPTPPEITGVGVPIVTPGSAASIVVDVTGVPPLGVKYLIKDPVTGGLLAAGEGKSVTATRFIITLDENFTSQLEPGIYEVILAGYSEEVAFVSTSKAYVNVVSFLSAPELQTILDAISALSEQISTVNTNLANAVASLSSTVNILMIIMAVVLVLVAVAIVLNLRKR